MDVKFTTVIVKSRTVKQVGSRSLSNTTGEDSDAAGITCDATALAVDARVNVLQGDYADIAGIAQRLFSYCNQRNTSLDV